MSISAPDAVMNVDSATVEYESAQVPQRIPPELRDDAADRRDVGRRRIRPQLAPVRRQDAVGVAQHGARLDARASALVPSASTPRQCRRTSTRIPSVWLWPFRLVPPARNVTGMPCSRP